MKFMFFKFKKIKEKIAGILFENFPINCKKEEREIILKEIKQSVLRF